MENERDGIQQTGLSGNGMLCTDQKDLQKDLDLFKIALDK
jgi:hypothetical protein